MILTNKFKANSELKSYIKSSHINGHRLLLFLYNEIGSQNNEQARNQVMIIHHLLSKHSQERPNVLWCLKKDSKYPRVSKSVLKSLEKNFKCGKCNLSTENAFHVFLLASHVTYCLWNETQNVLGKTFDICVIQDFEALTPNVLCQVIETVRGGGAIIFLLPNSVAHLKELFTFKMDVHSRLKTYSLPSVQHRFNERFILSLRWCKSCMVLDKDLKLRSELSQTNSHKLQSLKESTETDSQKAFTELLVSLADAEKPLPQLVKLCRTLDQAKAVLKMIDVVTEKTGRSTVSISAGRGRGKSAAMGLATAAAIYFGVNNVFVTSPSPQNLCTFFQFIFKGFDVLDYVEGKHYSIIESTNAEFRGAIVRVSVYARHRQVIQYVCPTDCAMVSQAELVIIDEAASIPLPQVKQLLGFYNVFMASTINGYEGTGRSLSLKLLKQLRQQTVPVGATATSSNDQKSLYSNCRPLHEVSLDESIRYRPDDPVEKWMNRLLCLDATASVPFVSHCPHAETCELFYVNRDVLFSGHTDSEDFLNQLFSLLVSSHYKNCPDDLQILADAPSHHLFVLVPSLAPKKGSISSLPTVFTVVQVCKEGGIPCKVSSSALGKGESPSGDLIPWTLAKQFLDPNLTQLRGIRVVRVATHPDYQSMGYGSRAIKLLKEYYEGRYLTLDESEMAVSFNIETATQKEEVESSLLKPRVFDSPLFLKLSERKPESLDYIGVSFGLTDPLFKFWKRSHFLPLHISQSTNKITGEHNCVMLHPMTEERFRLPLPETCSVPAWIRDSGSEFLNKFLGLLSGPFRSFSPFLSRSIVSCFQQGFQQSPGVDWFELELLIGGHDLKRLDSYSKNLSDRNLISDLVHPVAVLLFTGRLPGAVHLSPTQSDLLLGCGLQFLNIEDMSKKMGLTVESCMGQFNRALKRLFKAISDVQENSVTALIPKDVVSDELFTPVMISLDQDLEEAAQEFDASVAVDDSRRMGDLSQFAIKGTDQDWSHALQTSTEVVQIKSVKRASRLTEAEFEKELAAPAKKKTKNKKIRKGK